MAKVGQELKPNDVILSFDDTSDEFSSQLLSSISDEIEDEDEIMATNAPVIVKTGGTIKNIVIYHTIPLEEMTPSMRKIVEQYDKDCKKREKTLTKYIPASDANTILRPSDKVEADYQGKVKGTYVGEGIIIDFYIEYLDIIAPGDKTSSFSALKATQSFIVPDELAPYTDFNPERKIDYAMASIGLYKRMCLDVVKVGGITKFLVEMKWIHKNKYLDKIQAELKKK